MTTATAFAFFDTTLGGFAYLVECARLALEDVPDGEEPAVVDALRAHLGTISGELQTIAAARANTNPVEAATAVECQQCINRMSRCVHGEVMTYDNMVEIARLGVRGGAWSRWRAVVFEALERCANALAEAADALLACWREIADRTRA